MQGQVQRAESQTPPSNPKDLWDNGPCAGAFKCVISPRCVIRLRSDVVIGVGTKGRSAYKHLAITSQEVESLPRVINGRRCARRRCCAQLRTMLMENVKIRMRDKIIWLFSHSRINQRILYLIT